MKPRDYVKIETNSENLANYLHYCFKHDEKACISGASFDVMGFDVTIGKRQFEFILYHVGG